jgi:predicted RNA polymerase sigma factor
LLDELGRREEARAALERAKLHARNPHEAARIAARIERLVSHARVR